ncbi:formate/nitrite transporter family protein [Halorarum halophilum]|uniref:Formate/nitrite transporter family protein n=1 Tax=Halorarum halophilum TaxID=2743090 RepID=A0A7D5GG93_9EURY|nr:formate/nitrite transporter family protein [Halobaculum halophilum]QLG28310.1 formate/nitrite transporter family protein [Halobaculum halophilum]
MDDAEGAVASEERVADRTIVGRLVETGVHEMERPNSSLFLSGLSAGLDIGFGPLLVAATLTLTTDVYAEPTTRLLTSFAYAFGFVLVILGGTQLFTEHTSLAVLPVLDGEAGLDDLGLLWGLVFAGNVIGGAAFAAFAVWFAPEYGLAEVAAFEDFAEPFIKQTAMALLGGAVLAGWLMGLVAWLVAAADSSLARFTAVVVITGAIGFAHLPHSIAGNVEVLMAVFSPADVSIPEYLRFMVLTTAGNAVGGAVFVALLKYGYVVRTS